MNKILTSQEWKNNKPIFVLMPKHHLFKDRTNDVYGNFQAIGYAGKQNKVHYWWVKCLICGSYKKSASFLHMARDSKTDRCKCKAIIESQNINIAVTKKIEYRSFTNAKKRCINPKDKRYKHYGGRGIKFKFNSFEQFLNVIGDRPSKNHTLDRIDVNGHYEPGNVRWATYTEQARNKTNSRNVTQYDLAGNKIQTFTSSTEAETYTGIPWKYIDGYCRKKSYGAKYGCHWRFSEDKFISQKKKLSSLARKIDIYTKDKKFIKTVESACEAARQMNVSESSVRNCIQKRYKNTEGEYLFRYHKDTI